MMGIGIALVEWFSGHWFLASRRFAALAGELLHDFLDRRPACWKLFVHFGQHIDPGGRVLETAIHRRLDVVQFVAVNGHRP
jgi:hypothetical protein